MDECEHAWDDTRPTVVDNLHADSDIIPCKKCGAPLRLPPRRGLWRGTPDPQTGIWGPPFRYLGGLPDDG